MKREIILYIIEKKNSVFTNFLLFSINTNRVLSLSLWEGGKSGIYQLYRQFFSTFSSAAVDDRTTAFCRHPDPEAMGLCPFSVIGLICSFHVKLLSIRNLKYNIYEKPPYVNIPEKLNGTLKKQ